MLCKIILRRRRILCSLRYEKFQDKDTFYSYPPLTSDLVGMFKGSALAKKLKVCDVQLIEHKCMLLPRKNDWVAVKLLHT